MQVSNSESYVVYVQDSYNGNIIGLDVFNTIAGATTYREWLVGRYNSNMYLPTTIVSESHAEHIRTHGFIAKIDQRSTRTEWTERDAGVAELAKPYDM